MFIWDPVKAISNPDKHGVGFEEVASIFTDEQGLDWEDINHSHVERRRKRLGKSVERRILLTVYTWRKTKNGTSKIRIISARQANRKERKAYS